ncbi:MAG: hypothetical protein JWQ81_2709 [Amycolatopsis sp.]|jgi:hypothetical protein|uniref:DUF4190 domain-containing protein n=1 Tax=Amycolatopsis sp. TaxID=37632 RepID=UPI002609AF65|nr:DUF4190 domain-containing protein [Amycolatopsis sp.]MCU1681970.1 hypothetical protein [Amycolatopsis sp.]
MSIPPADPGTPEPYLRAPAVSEYEIRGGAGHGQPKPEGNNGFAVASLICGILSFSGILMILAVVFGCLALAQIRRNGQDGRKLAIVGLSAAGAWLLGIIIIVAVAVSNGSDVSAGPGPAGFGLKAGDCFDHATTSDGSEEITRPSCTSAHSAEAFAVLTLAGTSYPSAATLKSLPEQCAAQATAYLDPDRNYPGLTTGYLYPPRQDWAAGNHTAICYFEDSGLTMLAPVRTSGVPYSADQKRFAQTMDQPDLSLRKYNAVESPAWTDKRDLAVGEVPFLQAQIAGLSGAPWASTVQPAITTLLADLRAQLPHWQDAASANSAGQTSRAFQNLGGDDEDAELAQARTALGLTAH